MRAAQATRLGAFCRILIQLIRLRLTLDCLERRPSHKFRSFSIPHDDASFLKGPKKAAEPRSQGRDNAQSPQPESPTHRSKAVDGIAKLITKADINSLSSHDKLEQLPARHCACSHHRVGVCCVVTKKKPRTGARPRTCTSTTNRLALLHVACSLLTYYKTFLHDKLEWVWSALAAQFAGMSYGQRLYACAAMRKHSDKWRMV